VPTYQYTCTECGEPLEAVQKFSDAPLTVCPACGGRLRKVFSAVGIVFKGSGFYRTDSRNGSRAAEPAASSSTTSDSGSSNGSADKAAEKAVDKKADKKAEPAKSSSASEKVA
jgi:putative FmdB family regulatory protein